MSCKIHTGLSLVLIYRYPFFKNISFFLNGRLGSQDGKVYPWSVAHYVNMTSKDHSEFWAHAHLRGLPLSEPRFAVNACWGRIPMAHRKAVFAIAMFDPFLVKRRGTKNSGGSHICLQKDKSPPLSEFCMLRKSAPCQVGVLLVLPFREHIGGSR